MAKRTVRIAMNGVTGRLGYNQHLVNSIMAIRKEGGLTLANGDLLLPEPILVGRNADKLRALAENLGGLAWTTDLQACLDDASTDIYFDVAITGGRIERAQQAIAAGKHIYLEKPVASNLDDALMLARAAASAGVKSGTVQDKLYLPGLHKLGKLRKMNFFGRILSARLNFGWWVFDGEIYRSQRSSWNYQKNKGGGLILDMFPHWRYILDNLVANVEAVSCRLSTHIDQRRDESGNPYDVDVEDGVFAILELEGGIPAQISNSWATRVRTDDMLTLHIDGTRGSAVTTIHECYIQSMAATPAPKWHVDIPQNTDFNAHWQTVPDIESYLNSYRCGWELFLRHVAQDDPFPHGLLEGAKGVQLVEESYRSHHEQRRMTLAPLSID